MSDHDTPAMHHADTHDAGHDEHGHDAGMLGPVDWAMWGAGLLGVIVAVVTVAAFVVATGFAFNA
jgi:hypothetical protein